MKEKINELLKAVGLKAVALEQITTGEGEATLEADKFEAGENVFIVNEEDRIPVPVGEYKLDNGFMLIVEEEGIIASYEEMKEEVEEEPMEEETTEEVATNDTPNEQPLPKTIIESVTKETKFSADESLIEALRQEITNLKAEVAELKAEPSEEESEKVEEVNEEVELSKPITHNPENEKEVEMFKYANKKNGASTLDRVFAKLSK